ncbi:MAG: M16 family metallopeptidase [Anaeroplasmataceae bacterium]
MRRILINQTKKFSTVVLTFSFLTELNKENATKRSLIANLITKYSKEYPDVKLINNFLDKSYGTTLTSSVSQFAGCSKITISLSFVDPSLVEDNNFTIKHMYDFLYSMIYDENYTKKFSNKLIELEKENLKNDLLSEIEDKEYYSYKKLVENYFENSYLSINPNGYIDNISLINKSELLQEYKRMLQEDDVLITLDGNIDNDDLILLGPNTLDYKFFDPYVKVYPTKNFDITTKTNSSLSYLSVFIDTNIFRNDSNYHACLIFNEMLGGGQTSLLFKNIREAKGLCYSIYSNYNAFTGLICVNMSIKAKDKDLCINLIKEQFEFISNDNISNSFLKENILGIKKRNDISRDSRQYDINSNIYREFFNIINNQDEFFSKLDDVTLSDISNISDNLKINAIHFLEGEE